MSSSPPPTENPPPTPLTFVIRDVEGRGRGLFSRAPISRGDLIHEAPCLLVPKSSYDSHAKHTVLEHYLFNCKDGDRLLALGYGSIFNHSDPPNVDYRLDKVGMVIRYFAGRDVKIGEELCIYYGANLWFEEVGGSRSKVEEESESSDDENFLSRIQD
ncbi:hypothetical protein TrCOL_g5990 [Triparma columacea]|uniref:SET domain-containing protein n=1 Tax=Triparma columacea TaxID=722753 RepID=A0A9W7GND3_9STRA|nr:hypothetical protein TrCOL_g5990 [Triparma columacea]